MADDDDPVTGREPLDFEAVLGQVAARVEEVIRERGTFRAVNRSGVFVCR